jgi:hypothetical protein
MRRHTLPGRGETNLTDWASTEYCILDICPTFPFVTYGPLIFPKSGWTEGRAGVARTPPCPFAVLSEITGIELLAGSEHRIKRSKKDIRTDANYSVAKKYVTTLSFSGLRIVNSRITSSKRNHFLNQSYVFSEKICP